jgi:TrpR-related protein YerC/YecD
MRFQIYINMVKKISNGVNKLNNQKTKDLLKAILALESQKEAEIFLQDLLTEQEIIEFGNRWKAARMLDAGETYLTIRKETKLSERTIARISKWLKSGKGGYKLMIKKFSHHQTSSKSGKRLI